MKKWTKHNYNFKDLTGRRFGRLLVLSQAPTGKDRHTAWNCICDCGTAATVASNNLRSGNSTSCGCLRKERLLTACIGHTWNVKHGHTAGKKTPEYLSWSNMLARCLRPTSDVYKYYGAIGIEVCDRWNPKTGGSFGAFLNDMGERPQGTTLGRILDRGSYEPDNVFWMTPLEQGLHGRNNRALLKWAEAA